MTGSIDSLLRVDSDSGRIQQQVEDGVAAGYENVAKSFLISWHTNVIKSTQTIEEAFPTLYNGTDK